MKKLLLVFFIILINTYNVFSSEFELIENSVYRYKDGIIYAVTNKTPNSISILYADNDDTAKVLYYDFIYTSKNDYVNLLINLNNAKKRKFSENSELLLLQEELLFNINSYKKCPSNICRTTKDNLQNYYSSYFLNLSVDDALRTYVPNYKVRQFVKHTKKIINTNLGKTPPKHSHKLVLSLYINTHDGSIEKYKIINDESLTKSEEKNYKKALNKSAPFKVPKEFKDVYDVIPVRMKFNWKVYSF